MVCIIFTTCYSGGRQNPSVLFLSSSSLSAPYSFHRLFHCPSLCAFPERSLSISNLLTLFSPHTFSTRPWPLAAQPTLSRPCMLLSICTSTQVLLITYCCVCARRALYSVNCSSSDVFDLVHLPVWYYVKTMQFVAKLPSFKKKKTYTYKRGLSQILNLIQ